MSPYRAATPTPDAPAPARPRHVTPALHRAVLAAALAGSVRAGPPLAAPRPWPQPHRVDRVDPPPLLPPDHGVMPPLRPLEDVVGFAGDAVDIVRTANGAWWRTRGARREDGDGRIRMGVERAEGYWSIRWPHERYRLDGGVLSVPWRPSGTHDPPRWVTPRDMPHVAVVATSDAFEAIHCAVTMRGSALCWFGANNVPPGPATTLHPVAVRGVVGAVGAAVGRGRGCAWDARGALSCWHLPTYRGVPIEVLRDLTVSLRIPPAEEPLVDVAVGAEMLCRRFEGGAARCEWPLSRPPSERRVRALADVRALRVSSNEEDVACAVLGSGSAACFGPGATEGGRGDLLGCEHPVRVAEVRGATSVAAGDRHACALLADGGVSCWGDNRDGAAGVGPRAPSRRAARVTGIPPMVALTAEGGTTCGVAADGTAWCWGAVSPDGRVAQVAGLRGVRAVSLGTSACALLSDGAPWCWSSRQRPRRVDGVPRLRAVRVQEWKVFAIDETGRLWHWWLEGAPTDWTAATRPTRPAVTAFAELDRFEDVDGDNVVLVRRRDGEVMRIDMWWSSAVEPRGFLQGERWRELHGRAWSFFAVEGGVAGLGRTRLDGVRSMAVGPGFACSLLTDGAVACQGDNGWGQLGDPGPDFDEPLPLVRLTGGNDQPRPTYAPPPGPL